MPLTVLVLLNVAAIESSNSMVAKDDYIEQLKAAILIEHKSTPTHKGTYFVQETTLDGETVWEGHVEVFRISGHSQAKTCYAWQHAVGKGKVKIFVVLENQFVDSPSRAVQAALFMGAQPPIDPVSRNVDSLKRLLVDCKNRVRKIAMTVDHLGATVQPARQTRAAIAQKRQVSP